MVRGLTISQAEERIRQRFLDGAKPILTPDNRILVSLMRKRTVSVYVLRGDDSSSASRLNGLSNSSNRPVNIRSDSSQRAQRLQLPVPTRQTAGFRTPISRNDIRLNQGDVVVVAPRDTEVFYTSGLLGGGEFPIPRDRGLDVVEAVSIAGGSLTSNGPSNQTATELLVIRRRPNGSQFTIAVDLNRAITNPAERIQVRPGDVLMLRYSQAEQLRNIGVQTLRATGLRQLFGR